MTASLASGLERSPLTVKWRAIDGLNGDYLVSDTGLVKSVGRYVQRRNHHGEHLMRIPGRILAPGKDKKGYLLVNLYPAGANDGHVRKVHRLVLEAFVGPCPPGMVGCHTDGNPSNNRVDNLRWDTPGNNNLDIVAHGKHVHARKTHCPQGHPYDAANTYYIPNRGGRRCHTCMRSYRARYVRPGQ